MNRLQGKVAMITGAGTGIGRASARAMAREGAKVVVAEINPKTGQETVDLIKQAGGEAIFVPTDVSNLDDLRRAVEATVETYGTLNVLYNNAASPGPYGIEGVDVETWDREIAITLRHGFFATQFAIPHLRKAGGGSIIFTSSTAGITGSSSSPVYSAGKFGVMGLVRSLAIMLAKENIRVNAICPGAIFTPMSWAFKMRKNKDEITNEAPLTEERIREMSARLCPMRRVGEPEEVAAVAVFLASDEASYVTGIPMIVDGGLLA